MNPIMSMLGQMMKGGMNPQAMMKQMMGNNQIMGNPMGKNIMEMAQSGNISGIEELGRNIAKERGVDFDKAFSEFKGNLGMK